MSVYKYQGRNRSKIDTSKLSAKDAAIVSKSVEDLINEGMISVSRRNGYMCSCPLHEDSTPSFKLNEDGTAHCYSGDHLKYCKFVHYTSVSLVSEMYNLSEDDAAKLICDTLGIEYDNTISSTPAPSMPEGYYTYVEVLKFVHEALLYFKDNDPLPDEIDYFIKRGFTEDFIKQEGLVYCRPCYTIGNIVYNWKEKLLTKFPDIDPAILDNYGLYNKYGDLVFSERYLFPIRDTLGNIVGFSGRSLDPSKPKYYNTKDNTFFKKGKLLYNFYSAKASKEFPKSYKVLDQLDISPRKTRGVMYIVEGFVDALALKMAGVPNVVATMGTALTQYHLGMLKDFDIVLAFDNDEAGLTSMYGWALEHNMKFLLAYPEFKYKDFGEALQDGFDINHYINTHKPVLSPEVAFVWLKDYLDLSDVDNRSIMWAALSKICKRYDPVVRDYIGIKFKRLIKGKRG